MKHKKHYISDFCTGILFTIFFFSIGLLITINFRPLYYADIKALNISSTSGFDTVTIKKNYDALIDYCSPFYTKDLNFPDFPSSASALTHFKEVKHIFNLFNIFGIQSFLFLLFVIIQKHRKRDYSYLIISSITMLVLPVIGGGLIAVNFDKAFIFFHKIFFRNDFWIFDPVTDPVIKILPDTFFLHCALLIILIVVLAAFSLFLIYLVCRQKAGKK